MILSRSRVRNALFGSFIALSLITTATPALFAQETPASTASEPTFLEKVNISAPPYANAEEFVASMTVSRKEDKDQLQKRFERFKILRDNRDVVKPKDIHAFLLAPREKFCRPWNLGRSYDHAYLDIKYGVTISGPHIVGRMTAACDIKPGEKVLEIGTGSGYQSAVLSYLTDQVYTVEIIEPLAKETDQLYTDLAAAGYPEYKNIRRKADDGYYGWEEHSPYDKIIVTCGLDHIPPSLLSQLKVGGAMVIPVGPPGSQVLLMVKKEIDEDGDVTITREDVYRGRTKVSFVPFTKKGGGTHYQSNKK